MPSYIDSDHTREGHMGAWTIKFGRNDELNPWSINRYKQTRAYFDPLPEPELEPPRFVLLTWNGSPDNFGPTSWSPGARKKNIKPGDRVLLLRQGADPGFVCVGVVTSPPRVSNEVRDSGGQMTLVDVQWDIIGTDPVIRPADLPDNVRAEIDFSAQGGGEDLKAVGLFVDQEFRRRYYGDVEDPQTSEQEDGDINDTESHAKAKQRRGQDKFRAGVVLLAGNHCMLSGVANSDLLRASHIKPWSRCLTKKERLDAHNGLLLTPTADHLFDGGHITFEDDGRVRCASYLDQAALRSVGFVWDRCLRPLSERQKHYLAYHREKEFEKKLKKGQRSLR